MPPLADADTTDEATLAVTTPDPLTLAVIG
jgi:hypothetical protein